MSLAFHRVGVFSYGTLCYLLFLGAFFYVPGFMTNVLVPKSIDSGVPGPVGTALLINVLLLTAFAVQHSGMARPVFKDWLTAFVPKPAERSTYVLLSTLLLQHPIHQTALHVERRPVVIHTGGGVSGVEARGVGRSVGEVPRQSQAMPVA